MNPPDRDLRRHCENTVQAARDIAERAARSLLKQLGVERAAAFLYLSDPSTEAQAIDLLVQEVAYQHWHRMLFAR